VRGPGKVPRARLAGRGVWRADDLHPTIHGAAPSAGPSAGLVRGRLGFAATHGDNDRAGERRQRARMIARRPRPFLREGAIADIGSGRIGVSDTADPFRPGGGELLRQCVEGALRARSAVLDRPASHGAGHHDIGERALPPPAQRRPQRASAPGRSLRPPDDAARKARAGNCPGTSLKPARNPLARGRPAAGGATGRRPAPEWSPGSSDRGLS